MSSNNTTRRSFISGITSAIAVSPFVSSIGATDANNHPHDDVETIIRNEIGKWVDEYFMNFSFFRLENMLLETTRNMVERGMVDEIGFAVTVPIDYVIGVAYGIRKPHDTNIIYNRLGKSFYDESGRQHDACKWSEATYSDIERIVENRFLNFVDSLKGKIKIGKPTSEWELRKQIEIISKPFRRKLLWCEGVNTHFTMKPAYDESKHLQIPDAYDIGLRWTYADIWNKLGAEKTIRRTVRL